MKISRLPNGDKTNGWSAIIPARSPRPSLTNNRSVDWLVIGAGYAGLAAARRLSENCPNHDIAIVEAGVVGENASGRNSGFAIDLPHNVGSSLEELEGSHRFMRLARMSINHLHEIVETNGIECDWSKDGKYHAAVSAKGTQAVLEPFAKELEALEEPFEWIDRDLVAQKLGTRHFNAAIYTPHCILMNPAALVRGLADTLPQGVTLYENTPVLQADFQGLRFKTTHGEIQARNVIVANNGYSQQMGFYPRRFIHLVAHATLTKPLNSAQRKAYGVDQPWGLTPANAFAGITMRYTNDHRILIRQGLNYCPGQRVSIASQEKIRQNHQRLFQHRFPTIADVGMDHTWSGVVCLSQNSAPGFGKLANNVWSAVCQNAVGVTKGTFGGLLVADLATGRDNPLIADMESLGQPSPLPPRPFLDLGIRTRFAWELWSNRNER